MGRKCCVPGCNSNYNNCPTYTPSFTFPKEEERRALWIRSIHRENFDPSPTAVVCVNHFSESFIIREDKVVRDYGSLLTVPRNKLTLTKDAFPTIFPNQPSYLSNELPVKRASPSKRFQKIIARDEEKFSQWQLDDIISSFEQFKSNYMSKLNTDWLVIPQEMYILFLKIKHNECPKIIVSFKIHHDLTTTVWHLDTSIDMKSFEWILGIDKKCDRWTKFDCLINLLGSYDTKELSFEQNLLMAVHFLKECKNAKRVDDDDSYSHFQLKLGFIIEQIKLISVK